MRSPTSPQQTLKIWRKLSQACARPKATTYIQWSAVLGYRKPRSLRSLSFDYTFLGNFICKAMITCDSHILQNIDVERACLAFTLNLVSSASGVISSSFVTDTDSSIAYMKWGLIIIVKIIMHFCNNTIISLSSPLEGGLRRIKAINCMMANIPPRNKNRLGTLLNTSSSSKYLSGKYIKLLFLLHCIKLTCLLLPQQTQEKHYLGWHMQSPKDSRWQSRSQNPLWSHFP